MAESEVWHPIIWCAQRAQGVAGLFQAFWMLNQFWMDCLWFSIQSIIYFCCEFRPIRTYAYVCYTCMLVSSCVCASKPISDDWLVMLTVIRSVNALCQYKLSLLLTWNTPSSYEQKFCGLKTNSNGMEPMDLTCVTAIELFDLIMVSHGDVLARRPKIPHKYRVYKITASNGCWSFKFTLRVFNARKHLFPTQFSRVPSCSIRQLEIPRVEQINLEINHSKQHRNKIEFKEFNTSKFYSNCHIYTHIYTLS